MGRHRAMFAASSHQGGRGSYDMMQAGAMRNNAKLQCANYTMPFRRSISTAAVDFAAVIRPDDCGNARDRGWPDSVAHRVAPLPTVGTPGLGRGGHVYCLDVPALAVSSSLVRTRLASGQPVSDLVPARVARYIQRHRLYSEEVPR